MRIKINTKIKILIVFVVIISISLGILFYSNINSEKTTPKKAKFVRMLNNDEMGG
ncbi:hypothetical protein [Anaerosalibacter sp. Marseille-P3206]|uniref:hypothetical protein n=1 Tax=Anaerosalibacter sp. Marseille-P3206 TaxID=1871005 RepID=UPI00135655B2|nr:hypothetical protein [Anaerosalibacter sp. Marseille-P3206]